MATTTTNLGLTKPIGTEKALVSVINGNMDIIDNKVGAIPQNESVQSQISAFVPSKIIEKANGTSASINVPNNSRHFIICTANSSAALFIGYIQATSAGGMSIFEIAKGSDVTVTSANNTITLTITSTRAYRIADFVINGNYCS